MMYMYNMARELEKDLSKKQIEDIREIANKRIIFDDKIKSYTIIITDFIKELFGKDIIKSARIILSEENDVVKRDFIEEYAYVISICSYFNINYEQKSFEDENTYIEVTFCNDKKIGFWASNDKVVIEESEYN